MFWNFWGCWIFGELNIERFSEHFPGILGKSCRTFGVLGDILEF